METRRTVSVLTLGCRVNQYESDSFSAKLKENGVTVVPFGEPVRLAVVNTCTVTAESDRKSRQMIRRAAQNAEMVAVVGCYSQLDAEAVSRMEKVVHVCGNSGKAELADTILALLDGSYAGPVNAVTAPDSPASAEMTLTTPMRTRSYIKIEDGCENRCAYCIINKARGPVRSKASETVLAEVCQLAHAGAQEVILTGIETASYGLDFRSRKPYGHALADLIEQVNGIDGIRRIGLGSLDPTVMSDYFVGKAARCEKLLPHFHLSIQSGCSRTLAAMRRKYNAKQAMEAIIRMKAALPGVTFSADVIAGFPGETEEDFAETVSFCREVSFLHLHIFPYSIREGTEAASMENQVPEEVKHRRAALLEAEGAALRRELLDQYAESHRETPVWLLVEKNIGGFCSGHSEHFVEIGRVKSDARVGEIIPVLLSETDGEVCMGDRKA